jgi:nitrate/TMAO reductase-like tetraheme cytochrome c subunit
VFLPSTVSVKQLIETLHSNGFCASYGEVRRYLTSIAHHEIEKNQDGVYVPDCIIPMHQGGDMIIILCEFIVLMGEDFIRW